MLLKCLRVASFFPMNKARLLLDSHMVVWLMGSEPISARSKKLIQEAEAVFVSAASIWELSIKVAKGQLNLPPDFDEKVQRSALLELPVNFKAAWAVQSITLKHNDPFDRLLVAQAQLEGLQLVTADRVLLTAGYPFLVDARE